MTELQATDTAYRNGWFAHVGDEVLDEQNFRGIVKKINEDGEALVQWKREILGADWVCVAHLDLASEPVS